jgi:hypothetical protein
VVIETEAKNSIDSAGLRWPDIACLLGRRKRSGSGVWGMDLGDRENE